MNPDDSITGASSGAARAVEVRDVAVGVGVVAEEAAGVGWGRVHNEAASWRRVVLLAKADHILREILIFESNSNSNSNDAPESGSTAHYAFSHFQIAPYPLLNRSRGSQLPPSTSPLTPPPHISSNDQPSGASKLFFAR